MLVFAWVLTLQGRNERSARSERLADAAVLYVRPRPLIRQQENHRPRKSDDLFGFRRIEDDLMFALDIRLEPLIGIGQTPARMIVRGARFGVSHQRQITHPDKRGGARQFAQEITPACRPVLKDRAHVSAF